MLNPNQPSFGGDPPKLTPQLMKEWNLFLDFVKSKGYEGSTKLDHDKSLGMSLMAEFRRANPGATITYDVVPVVQTEMHKLKDTAQGVASRKGMANASSVMSGISKVDGFFGSRTSQFRFPEMVQETYHNDALKSKANLGLVDAELKPKGAASMMKKQLPKDASVKTGARGEKLYINPQTGYVEELK